jgi:hypothetical protein
MACEMEPAIDDFGIFFAFISRTVNRDIHIRRRKFKVSDDYDTDVHLRYGRGVRGKSKSLTSYDTESIVAACFCNEVAM